MSNQSGIGISEGLAREFPEFISSEDVAAILVLDPAKEHVKLERRISGTLDDVRTHLGEGTEAKYIALRVPEMASEPLAFVQFMPDLAPLSSKMKYASSHATIHRQLGGSSTFGSTIFWTDLKEVSAEGLQAQKAHDDAPAPLTEEEESLATAKEFESTRGTRGSSVAGQSTLAIHANLSQEAKDSLQTKTPDSSHVFKVASDESETIELVAQVEIAELVNHLQGVDEPHYVVATLEDKTVFAFVCPRTASIKQRMLFASTRISFLEYLKTIRQVDALVETFDPEQDLTREKLLQEIEPQQSESNTSLATGGRTKFQRPRPPKRR